MANGFSRVYCLFPTNLKSWLWAGIEPATSGCSTTKLYLYSITLSVHDCLALLFRPPVHKDHRYILSEMTFRSVFVINMCSEMRYCACVNVSLYRTPNTSFRKTSLEKPQKKFFFCGQSTKRGGGKGLSTKKKKNFFKCFFFFIS